MSVYDVIDFNVTRVHISLFSYINELSYIVKHMLHMYDHTYPCVRVCVCECVRVCAYITAGIASNLLVSNDIAQKTTIYIVHSSYIADSAHFVCV